MQIDELRQRYLAHYRVILEELNPENSHPQISYWHNFITDLVEGDPNSIYPFGQFNYETDLLMDAMADRYDFLSNAPEVNVVPPVINSVVMESAEGVWTSPASYLSATVFATSDDDLAGMNLYYSMGVNGMFTKVEMEAGSNGEYSALIPYASVGTVIRFYVEAISSNSVGTRSYEPAGAEHDTYYYTIDPPQVESPQIAINELMSKNSLSVADEAGEYDDWVELYNLSGEDVDLSGWHLSDNSWNLNKWTFAKGTVIEADGYLIVWADEDGSQGDLHANFKLSGSGESLVLTTAESWIVDQVDFPESEDDLGYARVPNGTGDFVFQDHTFASNNDTHSVLEHMEEEGVLLYPNPATSELNLVFATTPEHASITLVSASGQIVHSQNISSSRFVIDVEKLIPGIYLAMVNARDKVSTKRVIIQ